MMKSFRITFILVCIFLLFGCNTTKVYDKEIKKPENYGFGLFDEFKENFRNKDKITPITIAIEVANNSPDTNDIYPLLGTLKTSTNEEVEVNLRRY